MLFFYSGGIQLIFTGSNFDSVHSPFITINDSRLIPSSVEVSTSNDDPLCTLNVISLALCH